MAQRGQRETERLRKNAEDQVTRLMTQLNDLDELRDELTDEEYESEKAITLQQLEEFNASLKRMIAGDVTLVDSLGSMQLATQAAISQAFKTPEVIKLFALKQPSQLRQRLDQLQRDKTLGKLSKAQAQQQGLEVLIALKRLGDTARLAVRGRARVPPETHDVIDGAIRGGEGRRMTVAGRRADPDWRCLWAVHGVPSALNAWASPPSAGSSFSTVRGERATRSGVACGGRCSRRNNYNKEEGVATIELPPATYSPARPV